MLSIVLKVSISDPLQYKMAALRLVLSPVPILELTVHFLGSELKASWENMSALIFILTDTTSTL